MALRYGYFDSDIIGIDDEGMPIFDRAETSDLFALLFSNLISDGVLARPATCFQVRAANRGMDVEILPGFGMIRGQFCYDDGVQTLSIGAAPRAYSRIDRVVLRCNYLERMIELIVKTGVEAASPVPPELIRPAAGDYFEICLANIRLTAGQRVITQSSITDTRPDSSVCGYITQLIDHLDTAVFYEQFNAFYDEFVKKSNISYEQFVGDMDSYLARLEASGDRQLGDIIQKMEEFEGDAEGQWNEWFSGIRSVLTSVQNGKLLEEIHRLVKDMYNKATEKDIDQIIEGTYADDDDEGSIFEAASPQDIDDIIEGTYVGYDESGELTGEAITEEQITDLVNNAFAEV